MNSLHLDPDMAGHHDPIGRHVDTLANRRFAEQQLQPFDVIHAVERFESGGQV